MKKPAWLEKEELYKILFESDNPKGRTFDIVLMVVISLSIFISFIETIPSVAGTYKLVLEILEYLLTAFFTVEYIARVYCSPRPKDYPAQRTVYACVPYVPVHPYLPYPQVVLVNQRGLHIDELAQEEYQ